jgi:Arc/MetJ family transcription regulator
MRMTLNLPDKLVAQAMAATNISLKTKLVTTALENLIQGALQKEKIKKIKDYAGKLDLDIDLARSR